MNIRFRVINLLCFFIFLTGCGARQNTNGWSFTGEPAIDIKIESFDISENHDQLKAKLKLTQIWFEGYISENSSVSSIQGKDSSSSYKSVRMNKQELSKPLEELKEHITFQLIGIMENEESLPLESHVVLAQGNELILDISSPEISNIELLCLTVSHDLDRETIKWIKSRRKGVVDVRPQGIAVSYQANSCSKL